MTALLSILHLEDDCLDAELVSASLQAGGLSCELHHAASAEEFNRLIRLRGYDLILSDSSVPAFSGADAFAIAVSIAPKTPFIFVSGGSPEDEEADCRTPGASDYVSKNQLPRLPAAVRRAVLEASDKRRFVRLISASQLQAELLSELESRFEQHVSDRISDLSSQNSELRSFSYSVSHDLQAPLHVILGFSQALAEEFGESLGADGRNYLKRIEMAGVRMNELITGLLHLAVLDREQLARGSVDLTALAESIALDHVAASGRHDVRVIVEPGLTVVADHRLMRSLLENLIGNAVKFAPTGRETTILVGVCDREGSATYFVRDDGDGFSSEDAQAMFEPFKRLSVREGTWGHGIGLATARRIVEKHGGRISAESGPDQGATFYFTIPDAEIGVSPKEAG